MFTILSKVYMRIMAKTLVMNFNSMESTTRGCCSSMKFMECVLTANKVYKRLNLHSFVFTMKQLSHELVHRRWLTEFISCLKTICSLFQFTFNLWNEAKVHPCIMVSRIESQSIHQEALCNHHRITSQHSEHWCCRDHAWYMLWF